MTEKEAETAQSPARAWLARVAMRVRRLLRGGPARADDVPAAEPAEPAPKTRPDDTEVGAAGDATRRSEGAPARDGRDEADATDVPATAPEPEPEPEPEPAQPIMAVPDPEQESLLAKIAEVKRRIVDLSGRHAEMQHTLQQFQLAQYQALGECLTECLRLRHEYAARRAEHSDSQEDAEAARRAAEAKDGFEQAQQDARSRPPELDENKRDELKRLYRAAAMRCHPDRVGEAFKAAAQERFQRAQRAYADHDVDALRLLIAELDGECEATTAGTAGDAVSQLRTNLSSLRTEAADLILAIQTLQLDADYRRALAPTNGRPISKPHARASKSNARSYARRSTQCRTGFIRPWPQRCDRPSAAR